MYFWKAAKIHVIVCTATLHLAQVLSEISRLMLFVEQFPVMLFVEQFLAIYAFCGTVLCYALWGTISCYAFCGTVSMFCLIKATFFFSCSCRCWSFFNSITSMFCVCVGDFNSVVHCLTMGDNWYDSICIKINYKYTWLFSLYEVNHDVRLLTNITLINMFQVQLYQWELTSK